jgi:hypothetical protein
VKDKAKIKLFLWQNEWYEDKKKNNQEEKLRKWKNKKEKIKKFKGNKKKDKKKKWKKKLITLESNFPIFTLL